MTNSDRRCVIYIAGNRWTDVPGTDHQLVRALGRRIPVVWVDPPFAVTDRFRSSRESPSERLGDIAPGVRRLQVTGPPGPSRAGLRRLARGATGWAVRRAVRAEGLEVAAVVVASAQADFPRLAGAHRLLFATDDWVVGAPLMGLSVTAVEHRLNRNLAAADSVAAVSPSLAARLGRVGRSAEVLANGVEPVGLAGRTSTREPVAGLLGQLNERLDVDLLHAVLDAGIRLRVIGPLTARQTDSVTALRRLLERPEVTWVGRVTPDQLQTELGRVSLGLTPYRNSAFNRASFPLKTLEYLGAGLPVVATDLPSAHWLACEEVVTAPSSETFVAAVSAALARPFDQQAARARIAFAQLHNWDARAAQLLERVADNPSAANEPDAAASVRTSLR